MTVLNLDYIFDYMQHSSVPSQGGQAEFRTDYQTMSIGENSSVSGSKTMGKRPGKRPGRKPSKIDERAKLERSRQSARECRARKKLRYQYLEELVLNREKAVFALRDELETYKQWCSQLDNGGPVPETLLKMIVNEEEHARRKMIQRQKLQQQQAQMISTSSSSSPSSSESSPPSTVAPSQQMLPQQMKQQFQQQQPGRVIVLQQRQSPSSSTQSMSSYLEQYLPNLSPPLQQQQQEQQQQQQSIQQPQPMQSTNSRPLQRQAAFDYSAMPQRHQQGSSTQGSQSFSSTQFSSASHLQQHQKQQLLLQQQQQQQQAQPNVGFPMSVSKPSSQAQQSYSLLQSQSFQGNVASQQQELLMTRVKSEPPLRYEHSLDRSKFGMDNVSSSLGYSNIQSSDVARTRSLSNPVTMITLPRPNLPITTNRIVSSGIQPLRTNQSGLVTSFQQSSSGFGLFGGPVVGTSLSAEMPTSITIDDSSSSDENVSEQQLFQSSLIPQKRTLSDPLLPGNVKRSMQALSSGQAVSPASMALTFDPHAKLHTLTSVHCFSDTRTSNTPSPAPFGMVPSGVPSPSTSSRYSGKSASTPSSSTTPSPAPLSSLSSILELSATSPALSSVMSETTSSSDVPSPYTAASTTVISQAPVHCTTSGLSASIAEAIPEWYSFLEDLEGTSALTSRHGASSSHSTPVALTPKPSDQPSTPEPSFMNVPTIIDELLDNNDPNL